MLEEIEKYAHENNVPIMLKDGIDYLCAYIKDNNVKHVLEIGTAIGYSAIRMALADNTVKVVSIERDEARYSLAVQNIKKFNLEERISLIYGDATETEVTGEFDLIFIDASKGHSIDFFNRYLKNLKPNGVIITDNLAFHGLVDDETKAVTKNQKGLVKRIKKFREFLDTNEDFVTEYVEVGDRISISKRR